MTCVILREVAFQPTVLTVVLMLQCCVRRRRRLSVCDVMYCG